MHTNNTNTPSGTPFKRGVSGQDNGDPVDANDFNDIEAQRRHVLPVGKALIFDDLYRSRVMFIGDVSLPEEGKPVYHVYADPETLRKNGVADYFLDAALSMTTDVLRTAPEEQTYGFYVAPPHLDKDEAASREEYKLVDAVYRKYHERHDARARREAVYKCHRCKRQRHKRHPEDHEPLYFCSVPESREVNATDPRECKYFWFDRWYGSPPDVK
ncbi:MAG: hypothetical protein LBT97_02385 [Planctomycetota bacterium]|jgi:hypothetical protein|nr:hypothetical protein [Planctomycetota bacterium]